ncbi:hypothetical protein [Bordetella pertussis]|uniref:hypothetical protein n=1 Tax=Bordetella pertussis TaxID=520 RepID=UPI0015971718|nr:hypothetical protein [Bordetella pertussis]
MNWGVGDFQFLKSGSDEPCIQPIESSHLADSSNPRRLADVRTQRNDTAPMYCANWGIRGLPCPR